MYTKKIRKIQFVFLFHQSSILNSTFYTLFFSSLSFTWFFKDGQHLMATIDNVVAVGGLPVWQSLPPMVLVRFFFILQFDLAKLTCQIDGRNGDDVGRVLQTQSSAV